MGSKSAQKAARASGRRQERNKSIRSQVKTDIDKAAEKKVLHSNNASRRKSRLVEKLNKAEAQPKAKAEPEKAA